MRLEIPYGKDGSQALEVPDRNLLQVLRPNQVESGEEQDVIRDALDHPCGGMTVEDLFQNGEVLVIVNDGTRPTPTSRILKALQGRVDLGKATFLIATGAHRSPTEDELELIFGGLLERLRPRIQAHDSLRSPMFRLATSRNGTEIQLNQLVRRHDRILVITSVEPHYFAGYTGGRKSILPGVSAHSTIEQNHRLAMRPEAKVLALQGNPVHEDMMDCARALQGKRILGIQAVLDRHHRVYRVAAGELHESFARAVSWADEVFVVPTIGLADIVISIAPYPMDVDLYQSQKAIENAKHALKEGGTLILVSKCRQGIGEDRFYRLLASSKDPDQVLRGVEAEYRLGDHKAARMAEIGRRARVCGVTSLDHEALQRIRIEPFATAQAALDDALSRHPGASVMVIYEGSVVVPKVV
jgi:nickel-dependent lactate racemase